MPGLFVIFAPFALLIPLGWFGVLPPEPDMREPIAQQAPKGGKSLSSLPLSEQAPAWSPVFEGIGPSNSEQVRIERRVILRISPAPSRLRQDLFPETVTNQPRARVVARPAGKCVETANIGGVADRGDHLLMFMRDRGAIAARLEKGCSPRDFYRGFYVERSDDGQLCVDRDRIMSRSGAKCQVERFSRLVLERTE